ncbi:uncharacterized protein VP01_2417g1 [Puccinia sorghi]|uniref:Uncharacterized protein n=1 Tax=Puccinia sorghi TaxID=27349 RepID=A0A0L6V8E7_9BASI|nr:uncharacterized protein VP01_2417g1 [Puccinia sorghi]
MKILQLNCILLIFWDQFLLWACTACHVTRYKSYNLWVSNNSPSYSFLLLQELWVNTFTFSAPDHQETCIYVRKSFASHTINQLSDCGKFLTGLEISFSKRNKLRLINLYIPPGPSWCGESIFRTFVWLSRLYFSFVSQNKQTFISGAQAGIGEGLGGKELFRRALQGQTGPAERQRVRRLRKELNGSGSGGEGQSCGWGVRESCIYLSISLQHRRKKRGELRVKLQTHHRAVTRECLLLESKKTTHLSRSFPHQFFFPHRPPKVYRKTMPNWGCISLDQICEQLQTSDQGSYR